MLLSLSLSLPPSPSPSLFSRSFSFSLSLSLILFLTHSLSPLSLTVRAAQVMSPVSAAVYSALTLVSLLGAGVAMRRVTAGARQAAAAAATAASDSAAK